MIFSIFWIFSIGGCASTQEKKTLSPAELLKKGKNFVKLKETQKAKEVFQQVLEDFPDSKERKAALLYLADVHYRDGEYEEAKFHNQKFIELYPANPRADRAHYYKAMSDYQMMEIASRDQTHTHAALEGFETVVKNFPNSPYHPKAVQKKEECLRILAKSSFEIGKFYYRIKSYQSAIARLKNLM
ncbi:MAG: outer membrane protein assembly factor BamD, partial [Nitrospinaceae bacterium]